MEKKRLLNAVIITVAVIVVCYCLQHFFTSCKLASDYAEDLRQVVDNLRRKNYLSEDGRIKYLYDKKQYTQDLITAVSQTIVYFGLFMLSVIMSVKAKIGVNKLEIIEETEKQKTIRIVATVLFVVLLLIFAFSKIYEFSVGSWFYTAGGNWAQKNGTPPKSFWVFTVATGGIYGLFRAFKIYAFDLITAAVCLFGIVSLFRKPKLKAKE